MKTYLDFLDFALKNFQHWPGFEEEWTDKKSKHAYTPEQIYDKWRRDIKQKKLQKTPQP